MTKLELLKQRLYKAQSKVYSIERQIEEIEYKEREELHKSMEADYQQRLIKGEVSFEEMYLRDKIEKNKYILAQAINGNPNGLLTKLDIDKNI